MERTILALATPAPWAMCVKDTRGRRVPEPAHPYRSDYARDRDRIIHSRAFRRLEAKTQVFTTRYSDHFRNRLTHTLEVAQIARTVAGALGLNAGILLRKVSTWKVRLLIWVEEKMRFQAATIEL